MPYPSKPASKPAWTETNPGARSEPSPSYKETGWFSNLRPPYQFMNWLFYNLGVEWLTYFEDVTDALKTNLAAKVPGYDFTIGSGGDFADINAAMASSSVVTGSRLLIVSSLALSATQVISKANVLIDMVPAAVLSNAGANVGIQVAASRVRLKGGKMSGFTTEAILIDVTSDYTMIGEMAFASNTADVLDNNGKTSLYGIINE